jgi:hypothetical protein
VQNQEQSLGEGWKSFEILVDVSPRLLEILRNEGGEGDDRDLVAAEIGRAGIIVTEIELL